MFPLLPADVALLPLFLRSRLSRPRLAAWLVGQAGVLLGYLPELARLEPRVALFALVSLIALVVTLLTVAKEPWRDVVAQLHAASEPTDLVVP